MAQHVQQRFLGFDWVNQQRVTTSRFGDWREETLTELYDNGAWMEYQRLVSEFDPLGNRVLREYHDLAFPQEDGYYFSHLLYDLQGHVVADSTEFSDGAARNNDYKYVYSDFFVVASPAPIENLDVVVYPNPSAEFIHFDLHLPKETNVEITVFDLVGQPVIQTVGKLAVGTMTIAIPDPLCDGLYAYRVKAGKYAHVGKIRVQR
jgi:hypothetical protein